MCEDFYVQLSEKTWYAVFTHFLFEDSCSTEYNFIYFYRPLDGVFYHSVCEEKYKGTCSSNLAYFARISLAETELVSPTALLGVELYS